MRARFVVPAVLLVALLAACGTGPSVNPNPTGGNGQPSAGQPAGATSPAGKGKVDCTAIKTAARELLMVQLLAQLKTPDTIAQVKAKQIGSLDLGTFLAAMHTLHALDSYSSVMGDPKAALDFYEKAATAAQALFATDPMTQAAIDTYNQNVGTVGDFIGHQTAIAGAMDAAGC